MSRRSWPVLLFVVAGVVVLSGALLAHVRFWAARSRVPERGEVAELVEGLTGPVRVVFDANGIPHVEAGSTEDLWFVQGYLHARERFFQMELGRRMAAGRLAELVGRSAVNLDRKTRTWRLATIAQQQRRTLKPEERAALEAYARGVNAALERWGRWVAPELGILGVTPEPWEAVDSLGIGVVFQLGVTFAMGEELKRGVELARLGREDAVALWGWTPEEARRWIPPAEPPRLPLDREADAMTGGLSGVGSNNWAIAPRRTATGRALLANDPHLGVQMPGTWYGIHLRGGGLDVAGASIPGAPGVMIGHNRDVAWGFTMTMLDDQDLYRLSVDRDHSREFVDGAWRPLQTIREQIVVRGRSEPVTVTVRMSHVGPVVRDRGGEVLALAWSAANGPTALGAFLRMDGAVSVQELATAWEPVIGPSMNLVAADVGGHILHQVVGRVPIRERGAGRLPSPGEDSRWVWKGFRPMSENPSRVDPPEGFLATANHDLFAEGDVPRSRWFPAEFASPWRYRRIRQQLASREGWDMGSCLALQNDVVSGRAHAILGLLLPDLRRHGGPTASALLAWDGTMEPSSVAAHLFSRTMVELCRAAGGDEAGRLGLRKTFITPRRLLWLLAGALPAHWWDDVNTPGRVETRRDIVDSVLDRMDGLHLGEPWGGVHRVRFAHPFSGAPVVGRLLGRAWSRGPVPVGGSGVTVNGEYWSWAHPFDVTAIPSMRFVADVGAWDRSIMVLPVGNSGRPWSPHYDDQLRRWVEGRPAAMPFSAAAVEASAGAVLELVP